MIIGNNVHVIPVLKFTSPEKVIQMLIWKLYISFGSVNVRDYIMAKDDLPKDDLSWADIKLS